MLACLILRGRREDEKRRQEIKFPMNTCENNLPRCHENTDNSSHLALQVNFGTISEPGHQTGSSDSHMYVLPAVNEASPCGGTQLPNWLNSVF